LKEEDKDEFKHLKSRRSEMTVPERMDRLVKAMVTLEDRLSSPTTRKNLEPGELVKMVKKRHGHPESHGRERGWYRDDDYRGEPHASQR